MAEAATEVDRRFDEHKSSNTLAYVRTSLLRTSRSKSRAMIIGLSRAIFQAVGFGIIATLSMLPSAGQEAPLNWDQPAIDVWPRHEDVVRNKDLLDDFIEAGRQLFRTRFNVLDGAGRTETTTNLDPAVRSGSAVSQFNRIAGRDANSCFGCHNQPVQGGSGDFATDAFAGPSFFEDSKTISPDLSIRNERHTISLFGAGAIETLAREMTEDLHSLRQQGFERARREHQSITVALVSNGISFGYIVTRPDGTYDAVQVRGVDKDLVVKPFGWKGVAVSIREFTNFALKRHHGIQTEERNRWKLSGAKNWTAGGVNEGFTVGQMSALVLYQASLPPPTRLSYSQLNKRAASKLGETRFNEIGCSRCHIPALPLRSPCFSEPNPFNRPGTAVPSNVEGEISVPFEFAEGTGIYRGGSNVLYVAAYTDLKRHVICDAEDPFYCDQGRPQDFVRADEFLTAKLWNVGASASYGHRGDLTTVSEAIVHHSGEAKSSKLAFLNLSDDDKRAIIVFLQSLRIPDGFQGSTQKQ
jgi:hypothetical protein